MSTPSTPSGAGQSGRDQARSNSGGPPPWQRGSAAGANAAGGSRAAAANPAPDTQPSRAANVPPSRSTGGEEGGHGGGDQRRATAVVDAPTSNIRRSDIPTDMPDLSQARRTSPTPPRAPSSGQRQASPARTPGRGPRRAALQVKHIDPWSALKLSLVLSVALFLVWMIAVGVLYLVLDGMGVWSRINTTFTDFVTVSDPTTAGSQLIGPGRVFGVAAIVGLVNVVLYTALATLSAFVYNLSADLAGGVEVTLTERD